MRMLLAIGFRAADLERGALRIAGSRVSAGVNAVSALAAVGAGDLGARVKLAIRLGNENYPLFATTRKLDALRGDPR